MPAATELERQALGALRRMRERLDAIEAARQEPLAIVGVACRLPGAPDIAAYWDLLCRGGDAIVDIPPDRWDEAALASFGASGDARVPHKAGLLDRIDGFDAEFFGIAGREAQLMDPQQRIFLEVAWEALESAGIPPSSLKGSRTGVFVGTTTTDYLHLLNQRLAGSELDAYMVSGNTLNATAGRVSYTLGLQGPAMAIDTACSSSLVAIDRACRSVRDGESRLAIAGGVNLVLTPEFLLSLARWGMLAPDGHCKTFDAAADGFVRAEGCGVVLIKRLSDALADGDRIWALVRGWAVNQAGPTSAFAVPNGLAQAQVLRDALAAARVDPASVGYVEAHGTGTSLGDPIEMEAIASVYGAQRDIGQPLWVGAVKSNVGHLEAAAGVTGLIKTVLALWHRQIPPNVHFRHPTPHIPWDRIPVRVPTRLEAWPAIGGRRLAGVSAFGFSGTNAHLVLEAAPPPAPPPQSEAMPSLLLTLSARSPAALGALALRYADLLEGTAAVDRGNAESICLAASAGRSHLSHRLAVTGGDAAVMAARLRGAVRGEQSAGVSRGRVGSDPPGVAFLFTGQGAQYAGMGRRLAQTSPVFRDTLQRCAAVIDPVIGRSLIDVVFGADTDASLLGRTAYTQPALFAIEFALAEWWRSVGVVPTVVLGHSVGEFVAACCAGVLTLEDAGRLVALRGALMQSLPSGGTMAAVFAPEAVVRERLAGVEGTLAVAGINAPDETVVSGDAALVQALTAALQADGVRVESVAVSHAFHSPLMEPMVARFEDAARNIVRSAPQVGVVSSMTGRVAEADWGTPAYWIRQLLSPVRWFDAMRTAASCGIGVALEIGPHPVLVGLGRRALPDAPIAWLPSLRRGQDDADIAMQTLGELYVQGAVEDWSGRAGAVARARVELPAYPFQRERHWVDDTSRKRGAGRSAVPGNWCHPMLGAPLPLATGDAVFQAEAGDQRHAWVRDHRFKASSVWPAAASVEMMLAAARELAGECAIELHDVELRTPLILPDDDTIVVQTVLRPGGPHEWAAEICRAPAHAGGRWPAFAAARRVVAGNSPVQPAAVDLRAMRARCNEPVDATAFYAAVDAAGASFGASFRSLGESYRAPGEAMGRVSFSGVTGAERWLLHPVLLDGCLQLASVADGAVEGSLWLPTQITRVARHGAATGPLWCHARLRPRDNDDQPLVADMALWNEDGSPVASIEGVRFVRARAEDIARAGSTLVERWGLEIEWRRVAAPQAATLAPSNWRIVGDSGAAGELLAHGLHERGHRAELTSVESALDGAPEHVVHMRALDLPAGLDPESALARLRPALESALELAKACAASTAQTPPRLWFVTRNAQAVRGGESPSPLAAAVWGFARVVRAEHPAIRCTAIDIDDACTGASLAQALLAAGDRDTQLAVRGGEAWQARIVPLPAAKEFRIVPPRSGRIEDLGLTPYAAAAPRRGEVRIEVQAAGLNFRDVLRALGMVSGPAEALGGECAGVVTAVGEDVTGFEPGDSVFALAFGSLGTSVCVPQQFVAQRPSGLSPVLAAALPIACLTASYGLEELAGLRGGDRVLIHAATGGVGMAAVQLARLLGAEVFATAGSDAKRDRLRAMGIRHVFDSRSLAFRDEILALTAGQGVQVVLNALSGEFIAAGLAVVAPGGCFLEMGKRGIWSPDVVAQRFPGVRYHAFDLGDAAQHDAALAPRLFARLLARLEAGQLTPLPVTVHPMREAQAAFETMAHARHTGKLVLFRDVAATGMACPVRSDASYLVTGGFGALGIAIAQALAARGARHLMLLGRSEPSQAAVRAIDQLESQGVAVHRFRTDVADLPSLRALLTDTARTLPPLRGVIHAAGVLDDGVLASLDWSRFETVLQAKLQGGLNLAAVTARQELDFFVLFSAGAAWLGNPGQANYAAANASIDALGQALRASQRPATAIAWGRWRGAGMASARAGDGGRGWGGTGVDEIAPDEGVGALFELVERNAASGSVLPIDWPVYLGKVYGQRPPAFFDTMLPRVTPAAAVGANVLTELRSLPAHRRREALVQRLEALLRRIVGLPAERSIDPRWPLRELGMDSLMTVELRNAISAELERPLSATLVFDHPTLDALTDHLMATLPGLQDEPAEAGASTGGAAAGPVADDLRSLSEQEAEAQLLSELDKGVEG
ncbi:MAG TPA: SDR family NAD(P)-dependent oxidoreductase [Zeimonas sp.]|nr:SDR family NAD(P)-dependent oxidoreductase [Zeimonas sp.]